MFANTRRGSISSSMCACGLLATILCIAVVGCGRSSLVKQRAVDASGSGNRPQGTGGFGGGLNGTGGHTEGTIPGTGGAVPGSGGVPAFGGSVTTGGRTGTAGTGGLAGTSGTSHAGGAVGMGGASAAGGTRATGGSGAGGVGSGGIGTGGASHSGGAMATGGATGHGGASSTGGAFGSGGRSGSGGSSGGTIGAGGNRASGGAISSGGATTSGGTIGTGGSGGTGGSCGDGIIGPGEQCDLGADNQTLPAFWVTQSGQGFAVVPHMRSYSVEDYYGYSSSSAHTGLEAVGTSRILLYIDTSTLALSLVVFHGVDKDSTGEEQPTSLVVMQFSGLPSTTTVAVADDPRNPLEFVMTSTTDALGYWNFENNSDGGVLSGLPFPGDWEITIQPSFLAGISAWNWVQSDGSTVDLDLSQPLTIKAYNSPGVCRRDCTIPRCGDGILDGGELCDQGTPPANGCGGDCMSFN